MEHNLPVPDKFQHLRPLTIAALRQRNFYDLNDDQYRAIAPPVRTEQGYRYDSIAYAFDSIEEGAATFAGGEGARDYFYSRVGRGLPPVDALRQKLVELELGQYAACLQEQYDAILTANGMSAIFLLCLQFKGKMKKIIASPRLYGGSYQLIKQVLPNDCGFTTVIVNDPLDLNEWEKTFKEHSDAGLVFVEDDANPKPIKLPTIEIARLAHRHNLLLAIDTTIGTPYLRKPHIEPFPNHEYNTDFTVHSLSKNIGGYSEDLGGAIIGRTNLIKQFNNKDKGKSPPTGLGTMSAKVAEYFLRGANTLNERMPIKVENARRIVEFLKNHPMVTAVYHSGSDLLSFEVNGGLDQAAQIVNAIEFIPIVPHLGDQLRTMIIHPASTTHSPMPPEDRLKHRISDNLIRLAVGSEDPDDIIYYLKKALDK